ncbi:MAG: BPL-N domain-containing protein [Thermomicrobiales bacterium]
MSIAIGAVAIRGGWLAETRFANQLIRRGTRVLRVLAESSGLEAGTLIIPVDPSFDATLDAAIDLDEIRVLAQAAGIRLDVIDPSSGIVAASIRAIRIGLYGGGGAPFNHAGVLGEAGFPMRFLSDAQIRAGELSTVDVLVMPGGGFRAMHGQLEPLGIDGARKLAEWVRNGGMYIGSCAGAYDCAITSPDFVASCPPKSELKLINASVWNEENNAGSELDGLQSPGVGVVRVRNTSPDHPVMLGLPESFEVVHYNGPVFALLETSEIDGASLAEGLAAFEGRGDRFTPAEQFLGESAGLGPTLLDRAAASGGFSAIAGELGTGRVVAFGSHPEFGFDLAMAEWGAPAQLLVNAVLWQAAHAKSRDLSAWSYLVQPGPVVVPRGAVFAMVHAQAATLVQDVATLRARSIDPTPGWLANDYAMSVFGLSPAEIWTQSLEAIETFAARISSLAEEIAAVSARFGTSTVEREALAQIDRWLLDERPASWQQDGGYQGVLALLRIAHEMCVSAVDQWNVELGPAAGPYAYFHENPFHLVAGSYLAAVGCVGGAMQLMRVLRTEMAGVA